MSLNVFKLAFVTGLVLFSSTSRAAIAPLEGTCQFNGQTIMNDGRITAYQNSTVPFGQSCVSETRQCVDGILYGSYAYASCSVSGPASCLFNGQTILDGDTVTAYTTSTVGYGVSCSTVAQVRTCTNGVLSGNAPYASCEANAPRACLFNGETVDHGDSVTAFQNSSSQYGGTCTSETRTCNNGTLSGTFQFNVCNIDAPASCLFNGQTIAHGQVVQAFSSSSAAYGELCQPEDRTCDNGTLSGTFSFSSCSVGLPASCTFDHQTVSHGESVTAYQNASVPFGQTCQSQARSCSNGILSGTFSSANCSVEPAANCDVNGTVVLHGSSTTFYAQTSVPFGQTCQSEQRSCNNGVIGGSYVNTSCSVQPAANCSFNGEVILSGQAVTAYQSASVAFGQTCQSEQRTCANGTLSGNFSNGACSIQPAANCSINGQTVQHGSSITLFVQPNVPYGQTCQSQQRTCTNGTLSGTATNASCSVENPPPAASCSFNGQTITSGQSVTAFQSSSVAYGQTCSSQQRTCTNGILSGNFTFSSCAPQPAANCSFNGASILNGQSVTAYQKCTVPYGQTCSSQQRTCSNGTLSGTYTQAHCVVQPAASCTLNGKTIASGQSMVTYQSTSVPFGQTCSSQTRVCTNGTLSGTFTNMSCAVAPPANCTLNGKVITHGSSTTVFPKASVPYGQKCESEKRTCTNGTLSGSATYESCVVNPAPPPADDCAMKKLIWEFPNNCHGNCGSGNSYFKSRVSRDGGKTWTTIMKNRLPTDLAEIWKYMLKKYGHNQCGRPNVVYIPATHAGYLVMKPEYLPACNTCRFVEEEVTSYSHHQCGGHKKEKTKKVLKFVCGK